MEPHFQCIHYFNISNNDKRSEDAIDTAVTLGEQRQLSPSDIMTVYNDIRKKQ